MAGLRNDECNPLLPCNALCDVLLFTSLLRGNAEEPWFDGDGRIGAVEPLEKEIDGEPGGGVDMGLSSLDIDNVDLRRSHEVLIVLAPLNSKSKGSWLKEGRMSCATGCCETADSPTALISVIERAVKFPKLNLLDDDNGRPKEVRFRNLEGGAEAGWAIGDGAVEAGGVDLWRSKVNRDGAFLLPEAGLWSCAGFWWPRARPTAAIPTVPVAQSC